MNKTSTLYFAAAVFLGVLGAEVTIAAEVKLPAQSIVYLTTSEKLIGKKNKIAVGQFVRCSVWRDVIRDGHVVIKAGTPALAKVDTFKTKKVAGIKGKLSIEALETEAVDGNMVTLLGGYNKEGKGRAAISWSLFALVSWPLVFIPGDAAILPAGTVFDAYTSHSVSIALPDTARSIPVIDLTSIDEFSIELLYNELASQKKPKAFPFLIAIPTGASTDFVIDRVNGAEIKPIPLTVQSVKDTGDGREIHATVPIKALIKKFAKGINTIEASSQEGGVRTSSELVIDIQF